MFLKIKMNVDNFLRHPLNFAIDMEKMRWNLNWLNEESIRWMEKKHISKIPILSRNVQTNTLVFWAKRAETQAIVGALKMKRALQFIFCDRKIKFILCEIACFLHYLAGTYCLCFVRHVFSTRVGLWCSHKRPSMCNDFHVHTLANEKVEATTTTTARKRGAPKERVWRSKIKRQWTKERWNQENGTWNFHQLLTITFWGAVSSTFTLLFSKPIDWVECWTQEIICTECNRPLATLVCNTEPIDVLFFKMNESHHKHYRKP